MSEFTRPEKIPYWQLLQHPKWQQKRLEIMKRDNFKCRWDDCKNTDKKLNVHHAYYVSGRMPWQYPDWSLQTLCDEHHEIIEWASRNSDGGWWERIPKLFLALDDEHKDLFWELFQNDSKQEFEKFLESNSERRFDSMFSSISEKERCELLHYEANKLLTKDEL